MRITLEKYGGSRADLQTMVKWLNDPEVVRYSEQRHQQHDEESQAYYLGDGPDVFRKICVDSQFIGTITAYVDRHNSVADVGILIGDRSIWGQGYGTEAWKSFCNSLFSGGIRKIEAGAMCTNQAMIRICSNYQMFREGGRSLHFNDEEGSFCDMLMWGKFREAI